MEAPEYKALKNINLAFIIISIFSCVLAGSLFIWFYNMNTRVKQVERVLLVQNAIRENLVDSLKTKDLLRVENDSLLRKIEMQETKVEYYLQQIDTQSNWFIFFVSGVFVVFGIASYAGFRYEIKKITDEQHKQNIDNNDHFSEFKKRFKDFEEQLEENFNVLEFKILDSLSLYFYTTSDTFENDGLYVQSFLFSMLELNTEAEKILIEPKKNQNLTLNKSVLTNKVLDLFNKIKSDSNLKTDLLQNADVLFEIIDVVLKVTNDVEVKKNMVDIQHFLYQNTKL